MVLSTFHLLEFFITALYNPYVTSADSFLVNHSIAYTAAALVRAWHGVVERQFYLETELIHSLPLSLCRVAVVDRILDSLLVLSQLQYSIHDATRFHHGDCCPVHSNIGNGDMRRIV